MAIGTRAERAVAAPEFLTERGLPQYVGLFAVGAMAYRGDWLRRISTRMGLIWLATGVAASAGVYCMTLFARERAAELLDTGGFTTGSLLYGAWEAVICAGLCIGLMVTGRALVRRTNRFVIALSAEAYAAYMLHLGLVMAIQTQSWTLPPRPTASSCLLPAWASSCHSGSPTLPGGCRGCPISLVWLPPTPSRPGRRHERDGGRLN